MSSDKQHLTVAMVAACPVPLARGTPVRIRHLAESLAERGHEVHLVTYHLGSGELRPEVRVHRAPRVWTYRRLSPGPSYQKLLVMDPLLTVKSIGVLRALPFDIIHAHHYEGLLVAKVARLGRRIPLVYDAHTLLASELPSYGLGLPKTLKEAVGRVLDRRLPRMADHVISVTERIRDQLLRTSGLSAQRISVISNGVECKLFDDGGDRLRHEQDVTRLIFTGNLAAYQGIDLLLEAFSRIVETRGHTRLVIATESSFEPYDSLARQLGIRDRIDVVAGDFEQIPALLADSDVALSPRVDCDGIPQKILNYMAASKPVVAFKGSSPGLVHGQTAWLIEDGDVSAFADGAMTLMDDPELAKGLGSRARAYVERQHSWDLVARQTEETYRQILGLASPNQRLYSAAHEGSPKGRR